MHCNDLKRNELSSARGSNHFPVHSFALQGSGSSPENGCYAMAVSNKNMHMSVYQ